MLNLIQSERLKLRKSLSFKILNLSAVVLALILTVMIILAANMSGVEEITVTGNTLISGLDAFTNALEETQLNSLLLSVFAGLFICGDFSNRTICLSLSSGHTRFHVSMSKLIVYFMGSFVLILIFPIVLTTTVTLLNGFGAEITAELFRYMLRSLLLYLLLSLANASIYAMVAFLLKSVGPSIGAGLGFMLIYSLVLQSSQLGGNSLGWLVRYSSLGQLYQCATLNMSTGDIFLALAVGAVTLLITVTITHLHFKKADLK